MTKQQKLDIERWISIQVLKLQKQLIQPETEVSYPEKAIIASQLAVYGEMKCLLEGTLIVSDDYTELRPA